MNRKETAHMIVAHINEIKKSLRNNHKFCNFTVSLDDVDHELTINSKEAYIRERKYAKTWSCSLKNILVFLEKLDPNDFWYCLKILISRIRAYLEIQRTNCSVQMQNIDKTYIHLLKAEDTLVAKKK